MGKLIVSSALKTGGPELLREEYETMLSESAARGDQYRTALDDVEAEAQVAAAIGVSLDDLRPGMALSGDGRKRGWRDSVPVNDWTKLGPVKV